MTPALPAPTIRGGRAYAWACNKDSACPRIATRNNRAGGLTGKGRGSLSCCQRGTVGALSDLPPAVIHNPTPVRLPPQLEGPEHPYGNRQKQQAKEWF